MKELEKELKLFTRELKKAKEKGKVKGFALIGALALAARAKPRATQDIDFLVSAEKDFFKDHFPKIITAMGYSFKFFKGGIDDPLNGLLRIYAKNGTQIVDLIPVFWKWQDEMVEATQELRISNGLSVPVALAEDMVILKLKAGGPQDLLDVQELLRAMKLGAGIDKDRLTSFAKRAGISKKIDAVLKNI
jgi:hypothetical protein